MSPPRRPDFEPEPRGRCYDIYDKYNAARGELDQSEAYIEHLEKELEAERREKWCPDCTHENCHRCAPNPTGFVYGEDVRGGCVDE